MGFFGKRRLDCIRSDRVAGNRGTYTACRLSRHFASVVGWLRASVSAVMLPQPQFGGAPKCSVSDRTSQKSQLRSPSSPVLFDHRSRGFTKASPVSCERGEGQRAQHRRSTQMTWAYRGGSRKVCPGARFECVFVRCKKKRA